MRQDWRDLARMICVKVPAWKVPAFDYLTRAGLRFCVDFGVDNAVDKAREHWRNRRGRRTRAAGEAKR